MTEAIEIRLLRAVAAMGDKSKSEVEMIESGLAESLPLFCCVSLTANGTSVSACTVGTRSECSAHSHWVSGTSVDLPLVYISFKYFSFKISETLLKFTHY